MLNWSEHENESLPKPRPIVLPLIFWLASIACVIGILASISGCATKEGAQVCFLQYRGRTESGLSVVNQLCMTPEQFDETQK